MFQKINGDLATSSLTRQKLLRALAFISINRINNRHMCSASSRSF